MDVTRLATFATPRHLRHAHYSHHPRPHHALQYPDVSLVGHNYPVIVGGVEYVQSGTSATTPVFAAMLTLINGELLAAGKPPVGFVNPALYQMAASSPEVFHDGTLGNTHSILKALHRATNAVSRMLALQLTRTNTQHSPMK